MNTKRILLLIIMFLFLAIVGENNVYATNINNNIGINTNTIIGEELKTILNEEGKLVVTDTTMSEDRLAFLNDYISKYNLNGEYSFGVRNYNEVDSTCDILVYRNNGCSQNNDIEIVFEEKISDDFKTILKLKDEKFQVPSSTKNGVVDKLESYFETISELNENYTFNVAAYTIINEEESTEEDLVYDSGSYIDENCTKATIQMRDKNWKILEQHIVELSYLTEQSEEFKKLLNKNGELVFNSVKPKNEDEMFWLPYILLNGSSWVKDYYTDYPSEDYTSLDLTINCGKINQETHRVNVVYNYDKKIKEKLQGFVDNFPKDLEYFYVRDLELINYWINNVESDNTANLDDYSGEFKATINNNNIEYYIDDTMGSGWLLRSR